MHEGLPLIGTILRLLQYHGDATRDGDSGEEEKKDEHLQMLAETAAEFLADICLQLSKVKPNTDNFSFFIYIIWKHLKVCFCRRPWQIW